jgi:PKD repeat protein
MVTYTFEAVVAFCGPSAQQVATVIVDPIPTLASNLTNQELCEGQLSTIVLSNPNAVAGTQYIWTVAPTGISGASNQPTPTVASAINTPLTLVTAGPVGTVNYTIRSIANGCQSVPENVLLSLRRQALVSVPPAIVLCEPATVALNGTVSGGATIGLWSVVSGLGSLSATNIVTGSPIQANSSYAVDAADIAGSVTMRLTTNDPDGPSGLCQVASADYTITINRSARVDAGSDLVQCADQPSIQLQGSSTYSPTGVVWTRVVGAGTFSNDTDPVSLYYYANPTEINQTMTLMLTALDPDGSGPCTSVSDQMTVRVNPLPIVSYVGFPAGSPPQVAENQVPFGLTGNQQGGIFTILPTTSLIGATIQNPTDRVTFDPGLVSLGNNTVTYTYTDANGCTDFDAQLVRVNPITNVDFVIQNAKLNATQEWELCSNQGLVKLTGNPIVSQGRPPETRFHPDPDAPVGELHGNPISIVFQAGDYYIDTDGLVSDTYYVRYTFKNEFDAITYKTSPVHILASPNAAIQVANSCIKDAINFIDASALPPTPFPATIVAWRWDFDDQSFSNLQNPSHGYITPRHYDIELLATTDQGCTGMDTTRIRVGDVPIVDFKWSAICNNESTIFTDLSSAAFSSIDQYSWDFGDGTVPITGLPDAPVAGVPGTTGTYDNPSHAFTSFGTYDIKLTILTNDGCNNSLEQKVFILPYSTVKLVADSIYRETFDNGQGGWIAESLWKEKGGPSAIIYDSVRYSWTWGEPVGLTIAPTAPGSKAWWTGTRITTDPYPDPSHPAHGLPRYLNPDSYFKSETSAVNGPCFNLTELSRPMVTLDYWTDAETNRDGAVLQFSIDGGDTWEIVGALQGEEGINWYNSSGIVGKPGNQGFGDKGWSGKAGKWVTGRFNLDGIPYAERDQVRLRVAFGSEDANDNEKTYDGFAFDNFFVGDKTRNVLVEHFTNIFSGSADGDIYLESLFQEQITALRPETGASDFYAINYHLNQPTADPLNLDNPIDPAARALYMGVSRSPVAIMDGSKFNGNAYGLDRVDIDRRALMDPQFKLKLDTVTLNPALVPNSNNKLNPVLTITADTTLNRPLLVNVALVENQVGTATNVLRKLLFGPDGETLNNTWTPGVTTTINRGPIAIDVPVLSPNKLTLVAWVQDKTTRQIYQSVVLPAPWKIGGVNVGTAVENIEIPTELAAIKIHPNPANGVFSFHLPGESNDGFEWKLSDQRGVTVMSGTFEDAFDHRLDVDVSSLSNGVYIVMIAGPGNSVIYEKLVVMNHR